MSQAVSWQPAITAMVGRRRGSMWSWFKALRCGKRRHILLSCILSGMRGSATRQARIPCHEKPATVLGEAMATVRSSCHGCRNRAGHGKGQMVDVCATDGILPMWILALTQVARAWRLAPKQQPPALAQLSSLTMAARSAPGMSCYLGSKTPGWAESLNDTKYIRTLHL